MDNSKNRQIYEQRIYSIQDYISAHLDQKLTLERLANLSAFSPFHFHRIFKSIAGETLYSFIQRTRLEKSCVMLSSKADLKIIEIALSCGFSTPSSFSKAFKNQYGISPSNYREHKFFEQGNSGKQISRNGPPKSKSDAETIAPVGYISDFDLEKLYNRRKKMNVKIETLPKYRIAYMRQIGPYGPDNIQLMQRLKKWAITRDLLFDSSIILGIAHDDSEVTPPKNCRYDCCIVLSDDYELESNINETELPGGMYAVFPVEHTPEAIGKVWNDIFSTWLPDSGYQIDDRPLFERYAGTTHEAKLEPAHCDICVPVKNR